MEKRGYKKIYQDVLNISISYFPPNSMVESSIMINSKLMKIITIIYIDKKKYLITFDMENLTFSSTQGRVTPIQLHRHPQIFFGHHNVLNDVIVCCNYDEWNGMESNFIEIEVIKETKERGLHVVKNIEIEMKANTQVYTMKCIINRNNKIILFISSKNALGINEMSVFDVLEEKMHQNIKDINGNIIQFDVGRHNAPHVFAGESGEEIFIAAKERLHVYIYKSKIESLKSRCQMVVLQRYSKAEIKNLNLPKCLFP